jgi:hypothetical protein
MIQVHLEDCNGTHKLEENHPGGFQCPNGKPVCFGQPACLCKEVKHSLISIRLILPQIFLLKKCQKVGMSKLEAAHVLWRGF